MIHISFFFMLMILIYWGSISTVKTHTHTHTHTHTEALVVASREIGLEVNADKTKCLDISMQDKVTI